MSAEWATKTIGEVTKLVAGRKPLLRNFPKEGDLPFLSAKVMRGAESPEYGDPNDRNSILASAHDLVMICTGSNSGEVFTGKAGLVASTMARIDVSPTFDRAYVRYFLQMNFALLNGAMKGTAIPSLDRQLLNSLTIPALPIEEQKHIVRVLEEGFKRIAIAKTNAEKNLMNANILYQEKLRVTFIQSGSGWTETTIGEQLTLQRGFDITKEQQTAGSVPVVSSGGIKSYHNEAMVEGPGVVIGRKGTLGKVFYLEDAYWPHDTTLWVKDFKGNLPKLVFYLFESLDVRKLDSGTANPALNRNQVHPIKIYWPDVQHQQAIVSELDTLVSELRGLSHLYRLKNAALAALKDSLLNQAFSGELSTAS